MWLLHRKIDNQGGKGLNRRLIGRLLQKSRQEIRVVWRSGRWRWYDVFYFWLYDEGRANRI